MITLVAVLVKLAAILFQVFMVHGLTITISLFFIVGYPPLGRFILRHLYRMHDDLRRAELQTG